LLYAVEAKDEKKVAAGIARIFKDDPDMRKREFEGHVIWESVPAKAAEVPSIDLTLPDLGPGGNVAPKPPPSHQDALLPNEAITVAHGHLLIASHYDFLIKILKKGGPGETLAGAAEYKAVDAAIQKFAMTTKAAKIFSRTDEAMRPTYELVRQGKMPKSETMFARILNSMLGSGKKGVPRKQEINGAQMPDYDKVVRPNLGPSGGAVLSEKDGWFIKGILLKKVEPGRKDEAPKASSAAYRIEPPDVLKLEVTGVSLPSAGPSTVSVNGNCLVAAGGSTATNYTLLPGDRLFIAQDGVPARQGRSPEEGRGIK
jgi:hypothetical protein